MSHPSWVCGLKPGALVGGALGLAVTPFVGVWIETPCEAKKRRATYVTPFVGVWIETLQKSQENVNKSVTPFVGVWIETFLCSMKKEIIKVTPFVGVWIETWEHEYQWYKRMSHPSWVCGLKHRLSRQMMR